MRKLNYFVRLWTLYHDMSVAWHQEWSPGCFYFKSSASTRLVGTARQLHLKIYPNIMEATCTISYTWPGWLNGCGSTNRQSKRQKIIEPICWTSLSTASLCSRLLKDFQSKLLKNCHDKSNAIIFIQAADQHSNNNASEVDNGTF